MQEADTPPLQEAPGASSENIPAEVKPVAGVSHGNTAAEGKDEKLEVWRIGRRQLGAMLIGVILFVIVFLIAYQLSQGLGAPLLFVLPVLVPLFFGTVFGSWVGLVTGGVGTFLVSLLLSFFPDNFYSYSSYFFGFDFTTDSTWFSVFGVAAIGFIAGLALLLTKGRYNTWRAIALASGFCLLGPLMMDGAAQYTESTWGGGISSQSIFAYLVPAALPGLLLLPLLLLLYHTLMSRRKRT
jgi:energy-coupling factor transport system substrate-specific component